MVFSGLPFLTLFLPLTLAAALIAHALAGARGSNPVLLAGSLIFYSWGIGAQTLALLLVSIGMNYGFGLWADAARARGASLRGPISLAVAANLILLGYFKYANFLVAETEALRIALGLQPFFWENVALPIGISFFTFHALSYVLDVSAGRARVMRTLPDFALYITLFPQLIAGPIVRYNLVSEQLRSRTVRASDLRAGCLRFVHGLVKKVVIADSAGAIADAAFALPAGDLTSGAAWLAALAYTVQIYFDFSGYSDMAIGLARMLGFRFPENFNRPYAALSITDFWRRWHMTLSNWFRDYVYLPLGGSRNGPVRTYANLWTIFVLTGVWHGANWTFVIWGLYHGALLVVERLLKLRAVDHAGSAPSLLETSARRIIVFGLVLLGWVIFRSADLSQAQGFYDALFDFGDWRISPAMALDLQAADIAFMLLGLGLATLTPVGFVGWRAYEGRIRGLAAAGLMIVAFPYALMKIMAGTYSPFLYFQF